MFQVKYYTCCGFDLMVQLIGQLHLAYNAALTLSSNGLLSLWVGVILFKSESVVHVICTFGDNFLDYG